MYKIYFCNTNYTTENTRSITSKFKNYTLNVTVNLLIKQNLTHT